MRRTLKSKRGFTLLELMIAMLLLSILLAAVYSSFFISRRAIDSVDDNLLKLQEGRMVLDAMGRELESVYNSTNSKDPVFKLEGRDLYGKDAARLSFTSFSPLASGLAAISYYAEEKEGVITVFKKIRHTFETADPVPAELIDQVDAFTVEVMSNGKWVKTWDSGASNSVPDQIRITLSLKLKDRPLTLTETISPKINKI